MMKRRIFAMALAGAMILSLAACGGGSGTTPGGSSSVSSGQTDGSNPSGSGDGSLADNAGVTLTLNRTDIELNKAGATFQLRWTAEPTIYGDDAAYTSSDEKVATVDENGTVTAVAPGKVTITVEHGGATATASVNCNWTETNPAPDTSKPSGGSTGDTSKPTGDPPAPAASVNLSDFYTATTGKYEFGMLALADNDILDALYAGLTGIGTDQMQVYYCPMSMNNGEFGLVQVKDSKDADTVKDIFQARVDYMVGDGNGPGGAQYPMAMDSWENNSRIVSNGNYVMMVVHENCDDIVKEFNALF